MIKNSMLRVQKYLDRLAAAKQYDKEYIHSFGGKDGETPLLVSDLNVLLQFASAAISTTTHPSEEARIAELEKDAARLLYATKDYDGFVHVKRDKYEFTLECMEEAGRNEPTIEDELNGVRRLIDAAIAAEAKKGGIQP
jgi:hypothetical protein